MKFGGTSVTGARHWETIAELAGERLERGYRVVLVCSALAGMTDRLQKLLERGSGHESQLREITERHVQLAAALDLEADDLLETAASGIRAALERHAQGRHPSARAELLSWGEWLSSQLGNAFLAKRLDAGWVDARIALTVLPEPDPDSDRAWLSARCASLPDPALAQDWSRRSKVLVTQGFVASAPDGRTALLGRGGSDTTAALLAARLAADAVEIWTDVPGIFSADPREEPRAALIPSLDYAEALELAASGARVVHPRCIRAAAEAGIPVQIRDLGKPHASGTIITGPAATAANGIKAIARQDGMLVMLLENLDTRQQVGFLAWVFEVISAHGVSVDLVATSETTTTVAINTAANHLGDATAAGLASSLRERCKVQVFGQCSCVNLVGRGARTALARMGPAAAALAETPLLMLSQSANDLSISLLVPSEAAGRLCRDFHRVLIQEGSAAD
jgi:diaminopimelate decarboxylase/aspartate kinase